MTIPIYSILVFRLPLAQPYPAETMFPDLIVVNHSRDAEQMAPAGIGHQSDVPASDRWKHFATKAA
jgi:hypothetical protein